MNTQELNIIVNKIDEVKNLFFSGQNILPLLEKVFKFIDEIKPILKEIKTGLNENVDKLPIATENLYKVTESTENATVNIMNKVDALSTNANVLLDINQELNNNYSKLITKPLQLLELLYEEIKKGNDLTNELPSIANAINKIKAFEKDKITELNKNNLEILNKINSDFSEIMNELQFQDITSQRLNAVNSLLNSIKDKLSDIVSFFQNNPELINNEKISPIKAFDPNMIDPNADEGLDQHDIDDFILDLEQEDASNDVELEEDEIEEELIYEDDDEEIDEDEIDDEDFKEDEEDLVDENDNKESLRPKFDESYLDEDNSNDDDDDLLKYYK